MKTAAATVSDAPALPREPSNPTADSVMWYHTFGSAAKVPMSTVGGKGCDGKLMLVQVELRNVPTFSSAEVNEAQKRIFCSSPRPRLVACFDMKCKRP